MKKRYGSNIKHALTGLLTMIMVFGLSFGVQGQSAPILEYFNVADATTTSPNSVATGLGATNLTLSAGGILTGSAQAATWTRPMPYAQGNGGWGVGNSDDGKFFTYTVSADGAESFTLTELSFEDRATGVGPSALTVRVNGITVYNVNVADSDTRLNTIDLTAFDTDFEDITSAEVRIIGWDNGSRTTSGTGQFRVNGIIVEGLVELSDDPLLSVSPSSLTGFNYSEGDGPSEAQSFQVTGSNLDGSPVSVEAPDNFQVSLSEFDSFTTNVSLSGSEIDETVFVRLSNGLLAGDYSGNVIVSGGGAEDDATLSVSGEVVEPAPPFEIPYVNTLRTQDDFDLAIAQGFIFEDAVFAPAAGGRVDISTDGYIQTPIIDFTLYEAIETTFTLRNFGSGSNRELTVKISTDNGTTFTDVETIAINSTSDVPFEVLLNLTGDQNSETGIIRFEKTGGTGGIRFRDLTISESALPTDPVLAVDPGSLSGFDYAVGEGPSDSQSFSVSGENLDPADATVTIAAPDDFEVSLDDISFGPNRTVDAVDGELAATTVFVRLAEGLEGGTYTGDVTVSGGAADPVTVSLSGDVEAPLTATLPYEESFETDLSGVYVFRVSGANNWQQGSGDGRTFASMNGFNTGQIENTWLILPGFDLSEVAGGTISFETWYNFGTIDEDNFLKLRYSEDYPGIGDPSGFTWTELDFDIPGASSTWASSGSVDLSAISGENVYIAFEYLGAPGGYRGWRVDNIFVAGDTVFLPVVEEASVRNVRSNSATFFSSLANTGNDDDTVKGFVYSVAAENDEPELGGDGVTVISSGTGLGDYSSEVTGLDTTTGYVVRAYATNEAGTVYSETVAFSTLDASQLFVETFGLASSTRSIANHDDYDNPDFAFFGTADIRGTLASSGYEGASGGANVFFTSGGGGERTFNFSEVAVDESGTYLVQFGMNAAAGLGLAVEFSTDGGDNFLPVNYDLPTSGGWKLVTTEIFEIEQTQNLTLRFTGDASNAFRLDDVSLVSAEEFSITIAGDAGWRLLSLPVSGVPVSVLAGQNQIQGVPGANDFYGETGYEEGDPNFIFYGDAEGAANEAWTAPAGFGTEIESGQGFAWFFFNSSQGFNVPLPFNLTVSGPTPQTDVVRNLNNNQEFNLLGNPFGSLLAESNVTGDIQAGLQVWDPAAGEYQVVTGVAEFQGFFVERNPDVTNGEVTLAPGSGELDQPEPQSTISFSLNGVDSEGLEISDTATRMYFSENGSTDWDLFDLTKLTPLSDRYALISIRGDRNGEMVNKVVDSNPLEFHGTLEAPLSLDLLNVTGDFTLAADFNEIPESWTVTLYDNVTGETTNLRSSSYSFTAEGETAGRSAQGKLAANAGTALMSSNPEARFTIFVDAQPLSSPIEGELPKEMALEQNYPNPFNPTTQIRYDLPESADVRLDVFNIQGQRVSTLVSQNQSAGRYNVNFDASTLASGVYIYRLQAGNNVMTRKMTLIK